MSKGLFAAVGIAVTIFGAAVPLAVRAGEAAVVDAEAVRQNGGWQISVTLRHADEGWSHYADLWQVLAPDGTVLGERVLAHPHVNEQPFTRSLQGVAIPDGLDRVLIRARDSYHGFSEQLYELKLDGS